MVTARIDETWDGRSLVPVGFTDPTTGQPRREIVDFGEAPDGDPDKVAIRVGADPEDLGPEPYGDGDRWWSYLQFVIPAVAGSAIWLGARVRRLRRSRRIAAAAEPAYRMQAVPLSGRLFGRRWRLALFDVDARPGDSAVCVVPVVGQPVLDGVRPVDAKGTPRPGGEVVVREVAGRLWWPAGRAMVGARARFPHPEPRSPDPDAWAPTPRVGTDTGRVPIAAWVLLGVAVALFVVSVVASDDTSRAGERSEEVAGTVVIGRRDAGPVTVAYERAGESHTAQVRVDRTVAEGDAVRLRVDPERPDRVWIDGTDVPRVADPPWAVLAFLASFGLGAVAASAIRTPRSRLPRRLGEAAGTETPAVGGFRLVDGMLWWFGPGPDDLRVAFTVDGPTLCRGEMVLSWSWARHAANDATALHWYAAADRGFLWFVARHVHLAAASSDAAVVVDLVETVARDRDLWPRLADRAWLVELLAAIDDRAS